MEIYRDLGGLFLKQSLCWYCSSYKKKNNAENTLICSFPVEGFHQNSIIVDTELRVCLYDKVQNTSVFQ